MAQGLNRIEAFAEVMPLERELQYKKLQGPKFRDPSTKLKQEDHNIYHKFEILDDLSFRKGSDKPQFAMPDSMINNIIRVYHDNMAHCDFEETIKTAFAEFLYSYNIVHVLFTLFSNLENVKN